MAKSIVQLVLTIRNPVGFVKNYVRIHIIFQNNRLRHIVIYFSKTERLDKCEYYCYDLYVRRCF